MTRFSYAVLVATLAACAAGAPPTSAGDDLPDDPDASVNGGTSGSSGSGGGFDDSGVPDAGSLPDSGGSSGSSGTAGSSGNAGASGTAGSSGAGAIGGTGGSGDCTPGQSEEVGACAMCGTLVRQCNNGATWDAPICSNQGECEVNQQESAGCGNCGTKTRTCSDTCTWQPYGACSNEGVCAPGSTGADCLCSSNSAGTISACCGVQTCTDTCAWSCDLKSGAECDWNAGTTFECCGTGQWHFCSASCHWFNCAATSTTTCP